MISKTYRDLSLAQLLEKAFELGVSYEKYSGSCSQCTVAALQEILGFDALLVKAATSSCGGQASHASGACGGVIGGTMVLDFYLGRPAEMMSKTQTNPLAMGQLSAAVQTAKLLCNRFANEYGSILCPGVQKKIYGRSFNLMDSEDWKAFEMAGAHSDPSKCMSVVGNAAKWTLEILLEEGAVSLQP
jgi:C_GCAxxG_C_C family probable redox protein